MLAPQVAELAKTRSSTHVLVPGSTFGKDLMPRVAALLGVPQVSDIMAVHAPTSFDRPIYAGNAITTVEAPATAGRRHRAPGVVPAAVAATGSAAVEKVDASAPRCRRTRASSASRRRRASVRNCSRPTGLFPAAARLAARDNFKILYALADKLGAGVGASRAAVDSGYVPNDMQVGQTGKIIAPELYVAIGISGAIQHLAGIKDARTIVAINKDAEAPIFEVADIGLVGDLFPVVPELTSKL